MDASIEPSPMKHRHDSIEDSTVLKLSRADEFVAHFRIERCDWKMGLPDTISNDSSDSSQAIVRV